MGARPIFGTQIAQNWVRASWPGINPSIIVLTHSLSQAGRRP